MTILKWPRRTGTVPANEQLAQLFDSLNDVVAAFDNKQCIVTINQCWEKLTGISVAETLKRPLTDFMHPEDIPNWKQLSERVAKGKSELIWFRLLHTTGEIRWCEMRIQSVPSGSPFSLSATLCDITPQVRNEQVKEASHRSLESLVNRLPAMLYRSRNNTSWSMEYVSDGCKNLTGYSAQSLLNQSQISLGAMIHPDDAEHVWESVQAALQMNKSFDLHYRLTQKSGKEIKVRDKGRGLYSNSGMVLGVEGIILQTDYLTTEQ